VIRKAYELAQAGDLLGAAKECELQYKCLPNPVYAVEGIDFYVLAGAPDEALRFANLVERRTDFYRARVEFFRSLALWDEGHNDQAYSALARSISLGYENDERFKLEWGKRIPAEEVARLLIAVRQPLST
jgi:hypothetical protein